MSKTSKRGFDESDKKNFSDKEIVRLIKAREEVEWLLNRDYKFDTTVNFVCNRYQFSNRQRDCIKRAVCTLQQKNIRRYKKLTIDKLKDETIHIDGFNTLITLEVALSRGLLVEGSDGNIRDLAGLRGTYKIIDKTEEALKILGEFLDENKCKCSIFYLDEPVSNSGNLKLKIIEVLKDRSADIKVEIVKNSDVILEKLNNIVSSDAIIIDKCISYFNINKEIINKYIPYANVIDLK